MLAVTVRLNMAKRKGSLWISWELASRAMGKEKDTLIRYPEGKDRYQATQKGTGGLVRNHTTRLCDLLAPRPSIGLELFFRR